MTMLTGINHITLSISELDESLIFYQQLGATPKVRWASGAYLEIGNLWLCLSAGIPKPAKDYTHIAFNTDDKGFEQIVKIATSHNLKQWKANSSEGKSLYICDPDGHQLEIHVGNLASRLESLKDKPYQDLEWLE